MPRRKKQRRARQLIIGYLEHIEKGVFFNYHGELTDLVGKQRGIYALYKGHRLYYIGLASNLRTRIKDHLDDRHARRWDRFSLYLVRKADHIKELESLIMRTASPEGNESRGRLPRAENLKYALDNEIKKTQDKVRRVILDREPDTPSRKNKPKGWGRRNEKIRQEGKKSPYPKEWTNDEIRWLVKGHKTKTAAQLARELKRSFPSVRGKIASLKLKKHR